MNKKNLLKFGLVLLLLASGISSGLSQQAEPDYDSFEDGDYDTDPEWQGYDDSSTNTDDFEVNDDESYEGDYSLFLETDVTINNARALYNDRGINISDGTELNFNSKYAFNGNNHRNILRTENPSDHESPGEDDNIVINWDTFDGENDDDELRINTREDGELLDEAVIVEQYYDDDQNGDVWRSINLTFDTENDEIDWEFNDEHGNESSGTLDYAGNDEFQQTNIWSEDNINEVNWDYIPYVTQLPENQAPELEEFSTQPDPAIRGEPHNITANVSDDYDDVEDLDITYETENPEGEESSGNMTYRDEDGLFYADRGIADEGEYDVNITTEDTEGEKETYERNYTVGEAEDLDNSTVEFTDELTGATYDQGDNFDDAALLEFERLNQDDDGIKYEIDVRYNDSDGEETVTQVESGEAETCDDINCTESSRYDIETIELSERELSDIQDNEDIYFKFTVSSVNEQGDIEHIRSDIDTGWERVPVTQSDEGLFSSLANALNEVLAPLLEDIQDLIQDVIDQTTEVLNDVLDALIDMTEIIVYGFVTIFEAIVVGILYIIWLVIWFLSGVVSFVAQLLIGFGTYHTDLGYDYSDTVYDTLEDLDEELGKTDTAILEVLEGEVEITSQENKSEDLDALAGSKLDDERYYDSKNVYTFELNGFAELRQNIDELDAGDQDEDVTEEVTGYEGVVTTDDGIIRIYDDELDQQAQSKDEDYTSATVNDDGIYAVNDGNITRLTLNSSESFPNMEVVDTHDINGSDGDIQGGTAISNNPYTDSVFVRGIERIDTLENQVYIYGVDNDLENSYTQTDIYDMGDCGQYNGCSLSDYWDKDIGRFGAIQSNNDVMGSDAQISIIEGVNEAEFNEIATHTGTLGYGGGMDTATSSKSALFYHRQYSMYQENHEAEAIDNSGDTTYSNGEETCHTATFDKNSSQYYHLLDNSDFEVHYENGSVKESYNDVEGVSGTAFEDECSGQSIRSAPVKSDDWYFTNQNNIYKLDVEEREVINQTATSTEDITSLRPVETDLEYLDQADLYDPDPDAPEIRFDLLHPKEHYLNELNGIPIGSITLINVLLAVIGVLVTLIPDPIREGLEGFLLFANAIIQYAIAFLTAIVEVFGWILNAGVKYVKYGIYLYAGMTGIRYLDKVSKAFKGEITYGEAYGWIFDDLMNKYQRAEANIYRAVDLMATTSILATNLINTSISFIKTVISVIKGLIRS